MRTSLVFRISPFHRLNHERQPTVVCNRFLHCNTSISSPLFREGTVAFFRSPPNPTLCSFRPITTIPSFSNLHNFSSSSRPFFLRRNLSTDSTTDRKEGRNNDKSKQRKKRHIPVRRNDDGNENKGIILYERNPEANFLPKIGLTLSYFSSIYWTWYWADFLPAFNNSPRADEQLTPYVAYVSCAIGYTLTVLACSYVRLAVSKIVVVHKQKGDDDEEEEEQNQKQANYYNSYNSIIQIYAHSLPFMLPSSKPLEEYRCGEIEFRAQSDETKNLETALRKGGQVRGHIPLKANNRRWPLWMVLHNMNDIKDQQLLYEMLMIPATSMIGNTTTTSNQTKTRKTKHQKSSKLQSRRKRRSSRK